MKKATLNHYAALAALLLAGTAGGAGSLSAQNNIYVVRATTPEKMMMVPSVESISYTGGKAVLRSGGTETALDVQDVKRMSTTDTSDRRATTIPASFLKDFDYDIALDPADRALAAQTEAEVTDPEAEGYDDFVSHSGWDKDITITYGGSEAKVEGEAEGVDVSVTGNHVTVTSTAKGLNLTLKGASADGSLKLYADYKTKVTLGGVTLHNPQGPALNSQSKKRLFIVLADATDNSLSDGTSYKKVSGEDQRGCVFAEGKICLSGGGALSVTANKKNGIASDDYVHILGGFVKVSATATKGACVKAKDNFIMGGGALQVRADGAAAKAVASDSLVRVSGGKLTAIVTGDGEWDEESQDYSTACCLKSDYAMQLTGGELRLLATGLGGKGVRAGSECAKGNELTIDGAEVYIVTAGDTMPADADEETEPKSSPKGVKCDYNIYIKSGKVFVRCLGGYGGEGIESKHDLNISGGTVRCFTYDDGINAINSTISGGDIVVCSTNNDGYDCNGGLYINGGRLYAIGANGTEAGIDNDGKTFGMNAGTVMAFGGYMSTPWESKSKQPCLLAYFKKAVSYVALTDAEGNNLVVAHVPQRGYNPLAVLISSPLIEQGKSYRVVTFDKLTAGEEKDGLIENAAYEGAVTEYEFTADKLVNLLGSRK